MTTYDADVIIVGGGPVGMGLAIELGQRGASCVVVERYPQPQPIPKGQNLTQRTVEHFHFWGVYDQIRAAMPIATEQGIGGLFAYETLLGEYHYPWYERSKMRDYYFRENARLPQYTTEEVLRARVAQLENISVLYGWSAETIGQDASGATVTVSERDGDGHRTLHGKYLVGSDGSRSLVREQAGITETRNEHDRVMVLLVFRAPELNELLKRYPGRSLYNVMHPDLEGYWLFFGRVDRGETWFFHAPVPAGTTRDNFDFAAYLHKVVGARFEVEFKHIGFWDLRVATADTYRHGRVFIAGDAAHSHPPYGGFGINTGFEDATNLGWKLAATLEGWGGANLLDSYGDERRPVFLSTAKNFIEKFISEDREFLRTYDPKRDKAAFEAAWAVRSAGATSEVSSYEPNYEGSPIVFGPPNGATSASGTHSFAARPGHHLAPQVLSSGQNIFEQLDQGFTLLAFDAADDEITAFETAATELHIPLVVVRDSFSGGREAYEHRLVLVRPDQFVSWTGDKVSTDGARAVLRTAAGD